MIRSYTNSEQRAIGVLMLLVQERIIPCISEKSMGAVPIEKKIRYSDRQVLRREITFSSVFYRVKIVLERVRMKRHPIKKTRESLEGEKYDSLMWYPVLTEIETRPMQDYPWKIRIIDGQEFRKMWDQSYNHWKWQDEALKDYEKVLTQNHRYIRLKK